MSKSTENIDKVAQNRQDSAPELDFNSQSESEINSGKSQDRIGPNLKSTGVSDANTKSPRNKGTGNKGGGGDGSYSESSESGSKARPRRRSPRLQKQDVDVPESLVESAEVAKVIGEPKPKIGDSRPASRPKIGDSRPATPTVISQTPVGDESYQTKSNDSNASPSRGRRRRSKPVKALISSEVEETSTESQKTQGRYAVYVHVTKGMTQLAVVEGRTLIEHYVARPQDDVNQIDGNIYIGKVKNVLPGMEAAFVDIGTPKNAVLYKGDVRDDREDVDSVELSSSSPRIEEVLKADQIILCQVVKNPIGVKGARLTQDVSLAGRFSVLVPGGNSVGLSKRLNDQQRRRIRKFMDKCRPDGFGIIVRTAAANAAQDDLERDITQLIDSWKRVEELAKKTKEPKLLHREPQLVLRVLREELNPDFRSVTIDDKKLFEEVKSYVGSFNPELADRVTYFDTKTNSLPLFDQFHIHEQLHKALDRQVWLPSGGSLIIEHTEALTVIDVNTSKNVGSSNLEETVYQNNLEAAEEVARQLKLRDIGGIIVIDFIDMAIKQNRTNVISAFRTALSRDKTRTQAFDISELGLVEMTRKRVSEGLVDSLSHACPTCNGRGILIDDSLT